VNTGHRHHAKRDGLGPFLSPPSRRSDDEQPICRRRSAFASTLAITFNCLLQATVVAVGQSQSSVLQFENATHATVRVELVSSNGAPGVVPTIVAPRALVEIEVPSGRLVIDLVADRSDPVRIHRIGVDVATTAASYFRLTASDFGLFLLEDAGTLGQPPVSSPTRPKDGGGSPTPPPLDKACQLALDDLERVALWRNTNEIRYYRKRGGYLCGIDGTDAFLPGPTYAHFICDEGWTRCVHHEGGDFIVLPAIRTSAIPDDAKRVAQGDNPAAFFVQTWQIVALHDRSQTANMTTYATYTSPDAKPD
jgi:hypothetical protein